MRCSDIPKRHCRIQFKSQVSVDIRMKQLDPFLSVCLAQIQDDSCRFPSSRNPWTSAKQSKLHALGLGRTASDVARCQGMPCRLRSSSLQETPTALRSVVRESLLGLSLTFLPYCTLIWPGATGCSQRVLKPDSRDNCRTAMLDSA